MQVLPQVDEPLQPQMRLYVTPECDWPNWLSQQQWPTCRKQQKTTEPHLFGILDINITTVLMIRAHIPQAAESRAKHR